MKEDNGYLFNPKNVEALRTIRKKGRTFSLHICKEVNITYSWMVQLINSYAEFGFLTKKKEGARVMLELTELGMEFLYYFDCLESCTESTNNHITYMSLEKEFDSKVKMLQKHCKHTNKTDWVAEMWAIGHYTGRRIKRCVICNLIVDIENDKRPKNKKK